MKNSITLFLAVIVTPLFSITGRGAATDTLFDLKATGGTLTIGDKVFSAFDYAGSGLTGFDAKQIQVTASIENGVYFLVWGGAISVGSGSAALAELKLNYRVQANSGQVVTIDQSYTGSAQPRGGAFLFVDETVRTPSGSVVANSHLEVDDLSDPFAEVGDNLNIDPAESILDVTKEITLQVSNGGFVSISEIRQSFHQIDSPHCEVTPDIKSCIGGMETFSVQASGGIPPYSYSWNGPNGFVSNESTITISNVQPAAAGVYTVKVTDANGGNSFCQTMLTVNPGPAVTVNSVEVCAGGEATLVASASGESPLVYSWAGPVGAGPFGNTAVILVTVPGAYTVMVTDGDGCDAVGVGVVTNTSSVCISDTFTFSGSGSDSGSPNTRTFTSAKGLTVKVRAFSRAKGTGIWSPAFVGLYSKGLGVTDSSEDGSEPSHSVDNVGRDNFLLFEFSQPVIVDRAFLGWVSSDSDLNIWVGNSTGLPLDDSVLSSFGFTEENLGSSSTRWADFNSGQVAGTAFVVSAHLADTKDQFKINKLEFCKPDCAPPPPPPPPVCIPGTFTFSGSSADTGNPNVRTFTANGIGVKVSAFSRVKNTDTWAGAYVGLYSKGIGVTDTSENGSEPSHSLDNVGRDNFLLFEFSQPVTVDRAYLGWVESDSDLNLWIGSFTDPFNNHLTLNNAVLSSFGFTEENTGGSSTRWADFNSGKVTGNAFIIAARLNDSKDQFKVNKLEFCAPEAGSSPPSLPSPWNFKDVGAVGAAGSSGSSNGKFTVTGSGTYIWGTADEFGYLYQSASDDCSIVARVTGVQETHEWAKAGVMIRDSLSAGAKHASMFIFPNNGVQFQSRTSTGNSSTDSITSGFTPPYWLKVECSGNVFNGYASSDGAAWTWFGSQTISMGSSVYIGFAVTSHEDGALCTATFDNVLATP